jgi:hypothetical protein
MRGMLGRCLRKETFFNERLESESFFMSRLFLNEPPQPAMQR